jgi:hypothetical protein
MQSFQRWAIAAVVRMCHEHGTVEDVYKPLLLDAGAIGFRVERFHANEPCTTEPVPPNSDQSTSKHQMSIGPISVVEEMKHFTILRPLF